MPPPPSQQRHWPVRRRQQPAVVAVIVLLTSLAAAVAVTAAAVAPPASAAASEAAAAADAAVAGMLAWLRRGGAVVNAEPGVSAAGVRGAFASADIPAGGLIARVPMRLTLQFRPVARPEDLLAVAEWLAREKLNASGAFAPYLASMPTLADARHTLSYESFPLAYLHLLQDGGGELAGYIVEKRSATLAYWAQHGARLLRDGVTLEALRAAVVTLTTRYFNGPGRAALVPAYDLLNHANGCATYAASEPCGGSGGSGGGGGTDGSGGGGGNGEECLAIRTRAPIPRGAEVCNTYGWLAPDHMAFHYGFLPAAAEGEEEGLSGSSSASGAGDSAKRAAPPQLSRIDRRGFSRADMAKTDHAPPAPFEGARAEMEEERARLQGVLERLRGLDAVAAAEAPDPVEDPGGEKLALLRAWRLQRAAALAAEIARLDGLLARQGLAAAESEAVV